MVHFCHKLLYVLRLQDSQVRGSISDICPEEEGGLPANELVSMWSQRSEGHAEYKFSPGKSDWATVGRWLFMFQGVVIFSAWRLTVTVHRNFVVIDAGIS